MSRSKTKQLFYPHSHSLSNPINHSRGYSLHPYDQMPINVVHGRPFSQLLERSLGVERKQKVREIASRGIERHFGNIHMKYKNKQNQLLKSFKVRTCKAAENNRQQHKDGLEEWIQMRQTQIAKTSQQYLRQVKYQMSSRPVQLQTQLDFTRQEKIINQYNIIYQYKMESLELGAKGTIRGRK